MKILFIGYGSIAQRHKNIIENSYGNVKFYVLRHSKTNIKNDDIIQIEKKEIGSINLTAIFLTCPSAFHCQYITELVSYKLPIFVEKPVCINKEQLKILREISKNFIYTGCNLRFHPLINFTKLFLSKNRSKIFEVSAYAGSYLPEWRPSRDYKKLYSSKKKLGGGVDLDLMHEPDLLYYLFGKPELSKIKKRKVSSLKIDSTDWAQIYFEYKNFSASIILNYFRKEPKRKIEIVRENDIIVIDFINGIVSNTRETLFKANKNAMQLSYKNQINYFFRSIKKKKFEINSFDEALDVISLIL